MYPWLKHGQLKGATVVEPFKATTFSALDVLASSSSSPSSAGCSGSFCSGLSYKWTVARPAAMQDAYELDLKAKRRAVLVATKGMTEAEALAVEPDNSGPGGVVRTYTTATPDAPLVHAFDELGVHTVTLEVTYPGVLAGAGLVSKPAEGGQAFSVASATATLAVKYVRREMHTVDDEDREALFAAWKVLLDTSDSDGVAAYGADFMSHGRLSAEHNNLAGDKLCDHLHDGMGFVPGHISVNRLLEASLQSVDASVALPYWEYTIDVEDVIAHYDGDFQHWRKVLAFTDKWFGDARRDNGHVETGVFREFRLNANEFTTEANSYGLIRSPWNSLKDDRFARYFGGGSARGEEPVVFVTEDQMSTCAILQQTLVDESPTLGAFNGAAAGQAHGPIHMFTGGQSGTRNLVERMTALGFKANDHTHNQFWGNGVTFFFSNIKSLYRYGLWKCPKDCSTETPQEQCSCSCDADEIFHSGAYKALLAPYAELWASQGVTPVGGDGTVDGNATLYSMLELMCGYSEDGGVVMGDHASSGAASDPSFWLLHGAVERWLQLMRMQDRFSSEDWSTPVFTSNVHPFTDTCSGHHQTDKLVFGAVDGRHLTNGEYYEYLSPKTASLPYVYDNFEWKHCEALGYDIAARPDDDAAVPYESGSSSSSTSETEGVDSGLGKGAGYREIPASSGM